MGTDPLLSLLVRENNEITALDPRPGEGSPAWGSDLTSGAPRTVGYRGAFGETNWTQGWSYLSNNGIFVPSFGQFEIPDGTIPVDPSTEFQIVSTSLTGGTFTVRFITDGSSSYKVTQSPSLSDGFAADVAGATITADSLEEEISFPIPSGAEKFFFRIEKE